MLRSVTPSGVSFLFVSVEFDSDKHRPDADYKLDMVGIDRDEMTGGFIR